MSSDAGDVDDQGTLDLMREVRALHQILDNLAAGLKVVDMTAKLGGLVGSAELRASPIHRWYYYKEGFSPQLPPILFDAIGIKGDQKTVVDPFAGVATTALSLRNHGAVERIIGVEYSPFAHFVGQAKIASLSLSPLDLSAHVDRLSIIDNASLDQPIPQLAAFHNPEIFDPAALRQLLLVRDCIKSDLKMSESERFFFLLGVAAVIEDVSKAMKDGRALRVLRGRQRRRQGLRPAVDALASSDVYDVVTNQWRAMIEDLESFDQQARSSTASMFHMQGDARSLSGIKDENGGELIPSNSVGLYLYSPPYLNCLDYSEVYKLELWLLEFITDHAAFRSLREGTLRSHPSIEFPVRPFSPESKSTVFEVIDLITKFLVKNLSRPGVGRVHGHYFSDMNEVLREQYRTLEPGGSMACVVANSTFSRRAKSDAGRSEIWRLPILTDVIIARLAEAAGFEQIEIWMARNLQAKNVNGGFARESVVIARKPG